VVGAARVARRAGVARVLTIDMGGTSTDVALIDGDIPRRSDWSLAGIAVRVPVIDIQTVGAGGGSIARLDAGGSLRVGPESAGADPGPACYGRGTTPTVTDANVVLGRLDPSGFLGGHMRVDPTRAAAAIARLARQLGAGTLRTAAGVVEVANAAMARALRVISVERGHDPREFTLLAFGGAAGVHACALASELGMTRVLIPRHTGLLSAIGMAEAPLTREHALTIRRVAPSLQELHSALAPLVRRGAAELRRDGVENAVAEVSLQCRYLGQAHEISVPLEPDYRRRFDAAHLRLYGYAVPERSVEVLAIRVTTAAPERRVGRVRPVTRRGPPGGTPEYAFWWQGHRLQARRYDRDLLALGARFAGPALIVEYSSTVLVPPDWTAAVDGAGNLRLERRAALRPLRTARRHASVN